MADQGSEGLLSPFLRRRRLNAVSPFLKGRVLDVGCGTGALAESLSPEHYCGVEIDPLSLRIACDSHQGYRFLNTLPEENEKFDTVVALAVIEHVASPERFLEGISRNLKNDESARVVVTTPHPAMDWIHSCGASLGLFSKHADEEHEELLDRDRLEAAGLKAGLCLVAYRRFLVGANQLALFSQG